MEPPPVTPSQRYADSVPTIPSMPLQMPPPPATPSLRYGAGGYGVDYGVLCLSTIIRFAFLLYGIYQDTYLPLPYTDVDYYVFTDAARFVFNNQSPYLRSTYRYTPLLSWLLLPTALPHCFQSGKLLFVLCDLITGYLILKILILLKRDPKWSLLWLFNPMVITISTRGSSESLITVVIMAAIYSTITHHNLQAAFWLGFAIHLKIYPFLYVPPILLFIDHNQKLWKPFTLERIKFISVLLLTFFGLSYSMYACYGSVYLQEAFLYHLERLDHRHNFSIYNVSLYFTSFTGKSSLGEVVPLEKLAFVPQMLLSAVLIPLRLCYGNDDAGILISSLFIQTFTFITFNKVITSQYFVWFLCLLPIYLSQTSLSITRGVVLTVGWVATQALWLWNGYRLEFLGEPDLFFKGLWTSSCAFFAWNCYMIGEFMRGTKREGREKTKLE